MKRPLLALWFLALATALPASRSPRALGDETPILYVADSSDDRILRLRDLDASARFEPSVPGEIVLWYDGSGGGPSLSSVKHLLAIGEDEVFVLEGGTGDAVLLTRDENGDGDANDPGEFSYFYSNQGPGPRFSTPNAIVAAGDGSYYVLDDSSRARFIARLRDSNGDGDADDEGEAWLVYEADSAAGLALNDPESLGIGPEGDLYVGDSDKGIVARLVDRDGDGLFQGADESFVFFEGTEPTPLADVEGLDVAPDGAVYVTDEDTGLVLVLRDLDGDGTALADGESAVYVDSSAPVQVRDTNDIDLLPGIGLLLLDGVSDTIFLALDFDENGDALGPDEIQRLLDDDGESLSTPSAITHWSPAPPTPPRTEFLRGDANSDGKVDISDAVAVLGYLFLGRAGPACADAMDGDDSGVVNITDAVYALNWLFAGGPAPRAPFPETGPDPTDDDLECP